MFGFCIFVRNDFVIYTTISKALFFKNFETILNPDGVAYLVRAFS